MPYEQHLTGLQQPPLIPLRMDYCTHIIVVTFALSVAQYILLTTLHLCECIVHACRFHASALVCLLVRCACDPRHHSPDTPVLLDAVVNSLLLPRVAHLAFASPSCSCLHTAFLDALSIHTLPQMPAAVWQPLLLENFGLPPETDGVVLDPLPDLLFSHGAPSTNLHPGDSVV